MYFCSLLLLMNFSIFEFYCFTLWGWKCDWRVFFWLSLFSRSGWQDGITDILATVVFRKPPQKLWKFTYGHKWSPLVSHWGCLEITYVSYILKYTQDACSPALTCVYLQENADKCTGCMTFIYIINLACFNSSSINLNVTLFSEQFPPLSYTIFNLGPPIRSRHESCLPISLQLQTLRCASSQPDPGCDKYHDSLAAHAPPL